MQKKYDLRLKTTGPARCGLPRRHSADVFMSTSDGKDLQHEWAQPPDGCFFDGHRCVCSRMAWSSALNRTVRVKEGML